MSNQKVDPRELHRERLATTDEIGRRVYVHPEEVTGKFRNYRTIFYWFLISLYLILPWIHYHGQQSVMLDLANRKFIFFGNTFWGHDAPLLIFIFLGCAFLIAFITSIWGRVWCGWACPQTVFIDSIFRKIEGLTEGNARQRIKREALPLDFSKLLRSSIKWTLYLLVSLHISHSFLGYFVGTHELVAISMQSPSENWTLFTTMIVVTGIVLFDFGWFREQFCIIACPYGRFQSMLMDSHSLTVSYDEKRGDCINCFHCVYVCPTRIDIRRGNQMECIGCTQCIDACDSIMDRVNKPRGLIRYESENGLKGLPTKLIKPRSLIYLTVIFAVFAVSFITISQKNNLNAMLIRGNKTPYQVVNTGSDEHVINHYNLELYYGDQVDFNLTFKTTESKVTIVTPQIPFKIKSARKSVANLFFNFPRSLLKDGRLTTELQILNNNQIIKTLEVKLVGPLN